MRKNPAHFVFHELKSPLPLPKRFRFDRYQTIQEMRENPPPTLPIFERRKFGKILPPTISIWQTSDIA